MIAVIAGASGLVGSYLLKDLLADSRYQQVISIGRSSLPIQNSKLTQILVEDLIHLANYSSQITGDHFFCCLGTTIKKAKTKLQFRAIDHDAILAFAKIASRCGAQLFSVVSASGANPSSPFFYSQVKGQTEVDLMSLGLQNLHIFRPGLLIGDRKEKRTLEGIAVTAVNALSPYLPKSLLTSFSTSAEVLAKRMIEKSQQLSGGVCIIESKEIGSSTK